MKHNWLRINLRVFKLQRSIAVAWKNEETQEVFRLQRQLIISYETRMLAVRRVITNPGRKTPGVDGVIWETELELVNTVKLLRNLSAYQAKQVKRIYIPKPGKDEIRPLGIPTIFDRAVQALAYIALIPIAETRVDKRSFGFRPYRSTKDAIQYLFLLLAAHKKKCWVFEADIEKCFDSISHDWIIQNVPLPKHILKQFLKSGVLDKDMFVESKISTPQGGIISPTLSNYCFGGIETLIPDNCKMARYADDFVVVSNCKDTLQNEVIPLISKRKMVKI